MRSFRIWGYDMGVERSNTEFLTLRNVREGGFTVEGTGDLYVNTTAPLYQPGALYQVTTSGPEGTLVQAIRADEDGRLGAFVVHLGAARAMNQNSLLEAAGLFPFSKYEVSIEEDNSAVSDDVAFCPDIWVYPFVPCRGGAASTD